VAKFDTKEFIQNTISSIDREGIRSLVQYLEESTFYNDPASCTEHNNYKGGLAEHSLNTYQILSNYVKINKNTLGELSEDSVKLIGLLHDLNKVGTFQKVAKNVPLQGSDGKNKKREDGRLIFIEKEVFDPYPSAHLPYLPGQVSTQILKKYIKLTKLEDLAIQWHDGDTGYSFKHLEIMKRAQSIHKVILYTQFAKKEASIFYGQQS